MFYSLQVYHFERNRSRNFRKILYFLQNSLFFIRKRWYNDLYHFIKRRNFMKKAIPKLLMFFYLIPWATSLLFIGLDALFNAMYLKWLWIPDWCMIVPYTAGYYIGNFAIFAVCGIFVYYIFFEKAWKGALLTGVTVLFSVLVPTSHYLLQHIMLKDVLYDVGMLDYYYEFNTSLMISLMNVALFLLAALLIRAAYALFLMKKPPNTARIWSPRNPAGLVTVIFYAAAVILATVIFIGDGVFEAETFLQLGIEYLLNVGRFVCTAFAAFMASKWNGKVGTAAPNPALR